MTADPTRVQKFSCNGCGKCCDRGPEMELSESLALADEFILSLVFKVHSLPRNERSENARRWWRTLDTRLGAGPALKEHRRQLEFFAAHRQVDRAGDRQLFLTISAIVEDQGDGRCPALVANECGIYDRRPLTCRTVPLHYSRPPSVLASYLDGFVSTPGYECETLDSPDILRGSEVLSGEIQRFRDEAIAIAKRDGEWKFLLVGLMQNAASARGAGLPTVADVFANSDRGYASLVPIVHAWRAAVDANLLGRLSFIELCRKQAALIEAAVSTNPARRRDLVDKALLYQTALSGVSESA